MKFKLLEIVVLDRDCPEHRLLRGDVGTVVHIYEPDSIEVEFVSATGQTEAVLTLKESDVRTPADGDLMSIRRDRSS